MSIQSRLLEDMKTFMKRGEKEALFVIRMTRAAIKNVEIEKQKELDEEEIIAVLRGEIRMRQEAIAENQRLQKAQEVEKLKQEVEMLMGYVPEHLSEQELRVLITESIVQLQAAGKKDFGEVIGVVMDKVKGQAGGEQVRELVLELLPD